MTRLPSAVGLGLAVFTMAAAAGPGQQHPPLDATHGRPLLSAPAAIGGPRVERGSGGGPRFPLLPAGARNAPAPVPAAIRPAPGSAVLNSTAAAPVPASAATKPMRPTARIPVPRPAAAATPAATAPGAAAPAQPAAPGQGGGSPADAVPPPAQPSR